jgi:hypothetical protein
MVKNSFLFGLIFGLLLSLGCDKQEQVSMKGILMGKVSIGPLCPVETDPPDPDCLPTEETFKAWPIAVSTANGKRKIVQLHPNPDGTYDVELPVGNYLVNLENQQSYGPGGSNLPVLIEINRSDTTRLDIDIDTGIR